MVPVSPDSVGRFVTVAEAAEILSLTTPEVLEMIASSELPAIRVGSPTGWRIAVAALESFIEGKYEEARRMSLWREANDASIRDIATGRRG